MEEQWRTILEFPNYQISNKGRVFNLRTKREMNTSSTNYGHSKITLTDYDGKRYTRSVALLVAQAFVPAPNIMCDTLMVLDGNLDNVDATNLAWRPNWFAWKYTRQLKTIQPVHYHNLHVMNTTLGIEYSSIIEAGIAEGLLFSDIWESTYTGKKVYPDGCSFEILVRV